MKINDTMTGKKEWSKRMAEEKIFCRYAEFHNNDIDPVWQDGDLDVVLRLKDRRLIALAGAGGKTSLLYAICESMGKDQKAAVGCTTTQMFLSEENLCLAEDPDTITDEARKRSFVIAGTVNTKGKLGPMAEEVFGSVMRKADLVCVEADGSRRLPIKAPGENEPVIPDKTELLIVVIGLSAVGKPVKDVTCRIGEVCRITEGLPEDRISEKDAARILYFGYVKPLKEQFPEMEIVPVLNQADDDDRISKGEEIGRILAETDRKTRILSLCLLTSMPESKRRDRKED